MCGTRQLVGRWKLVQTWLRRSPFGVTSSQEIQIKGDFSAVEKNNGGIDGMVQRLPSAEMSPFPQPAAPSKDYRTASPSPASHRAQRLQHVESMCAKISDRVAEVQRAINGPHCAACEWKSEKKLMCTQSPHLHNSKSF